jgi:hypothetical protein
MPLTELGKWKVERVLSVTRESETFETVDKGAALEKYSEWCGDSESDMVFMHAYVATDLGSHWTLVHDNVPG